MSLKIGLISDIHASPEPLQEALTLFKREGVEAILCAGDIAGYGSGLERCTELLRNHDCRCILGNHDLWHLERTVEIDEGPAEDYLRTLPVIVETGFAGISLYMVHASPPASLMDGIKLLDEAGTLMPSECERWTEFLAAFTHDVLIVGHTHQLFAERLGRTLVINPGSTVFNHSCAILTLPEQTLQILPLSGKEPLPAWNWGMLVQP